MFCSQCGKQNQPNNKFCSSCGVALRRAAEDQIETIVAPAPPAEKNEPDTTPRLPQLSKPSTENPIPPPPSPFDNNYSPAAQDENDIAETLYTPVRQTAEPLSLPPSSPPQSPPQVQPLPAIPPGSNNRGGGAKILWIVALLLVLGLLGIGAAGAGGVLYFYGGDLGLWAKQPATPPLDAPADDKKTDGDIKTVPETPLAPEAPAGMVYVPGGDFQMGRAGGDEYENPPRRVTVKPFFIDITEVTNEEYQKFVADTNRKPPPTWSGAGGSFPAGAERKPVTGVTWDDATAFAKWSGKRLPTEAEWEFAARGTDGRIYPWGNNWKPSNANADNQMQEMQITGLTGGKSPFGAFDMSGNAWEWTADAAAPYPNGKPFPTSSVDPKIIRGGFWGSKPEQATATFRRPYGARNETDYKNTGFRCAKDAK